MPNAEALRKTAEAKRLRAHALDEKDTATDLPERNSSYEYEDLIKSGHGELFGPDNGRLPLV